MGNEATHVSYVTKYTAHSEIGAICAIAVWSYFFDGSNSFLDFLRNLVTALVTS